MAAASLQHLSVINASRSAFALTILLSVAEEVRALPAHHAVSDPPSLGLRVIKAYTKGYTDTQVRSP